MWQVMMNSKQKPSPSLLWLPSMRQAAFGAMLASSFLLCTTGYAKTWKINLRDAGFVSFVSEVADITGKNFVVDPRITGNVTVISNKALTQDEVYNLFLGVLSVNNVVAIPSGNTIKLVPDVSAKQSGVPFDVRRNKNADMVITRVLPIDNANPADVIAAVRPLMSQSAHMAAVPGSNTLIVSDRSGNIDQLESLINALDRNNGDQYEFVALSQTTPAEIMDMIEQTTATTSAGAASAAKLGGSVVADNRNNRLIVKGDKASRDKIKKLIAKLDILPASKLGGLRVFKLKHANAKDMASVLQALVDNSKPTLSSNRSSTATGSSAPANTALANANASTSGQSGSGISLNNSSTTGANIFADENLNAVIVKANPTLIREIESAINQLDIARPQVLIQAAIIEVSGNNMQQLGVQWAMGNPNTGVGVVNFSDAGPSLTALASSYAAAATGGITALTSVPSIGGAVFGAGKSSVDANGNRSFYGAVLQALETNSKSNLLSAPYVTTMDNKQATLLVGQNVPFITGSTTTTSAGTSNPFTTIERQDVGISLKVTPHIGDGGTITLDVEQEVSSVTPTTSGISSSDLITNKRKITTSVLAENQQIIALGGLMQDDSSATGSAVPGLSKIPLIGALFRARNKTFLKRNLLVFLQPTILENANSMNEVTQKGYARLHELQLYLDPKGELTRLSKDRIGQVYDK